MGPENGTSGDCAWSPGSSIDTPYYQCDEAAPGFAVTSELGGLKHHVRGVMFTRTPMPAIPCILCIPTVLFANVLRTLSRALTRSTTHCKPSAAQLCFGVDVAFKCTSRVSHTFAGSSPQSVTTSISLSTGYRLGPRRQLGLPGRALRQDMQA